MRILSVVGARPQFVKLSPVAAECDARGVEHVIVHTGQHYDPALSDVFFTDLGIPDPDVHLGVGSGTHGVQTGAILAAITPRPAGPRFAPRHQSPVPTLSLAGLPQPGKLRQPWSARTNQKGCTIPHLAPGQ